MHCELEGGGAACIRQCAALPRQQLAVLSLNTIHNLDRADLITALKEMERLAPGRGFVQVDLTDLEQKAVFEEWVLTAKFHDYPMAGFACSTRPATLGITGRSSSRGSRERKALTANQVPAV